MKAVESGELRLSSTTIEQYLPSTELARLLELSDNELSRLARSAVLVRQPDPLDSRRYVFPAWENVRRYVLYDRRAKKQHTPCG